LPHRVEQWNAGGANATRVAGVIVNRHTIEPDAGLHGANLAGANLTGANLTEMLQCEVQIKETSN